MRIDISKEKDYYTQRNNRIDPLNACSVTSMVMALSYIGVDFTEFEKRGIQPEDDLLQFLRTNPEVYNFYELIDPYRAREWKNNPSNPLAIPPNEYHSVLAYGTNLWLGKKDVVTFHTNFTIFSIVQELAYKKSPLVQSAKWGNLNHIFCTVGFISTMNLENYDNISSIFPLVNSVTHFIIDDPFGNPLTNFKDVNGNSVEIPYDMYISHVKPLNNIEMKWAHVFAKENL